MMLNTCSVLLHDDTVYNVFERFRKLCQLVQTLLYYIASPLVNFVMLICVTSNSGL